jgi:peptide/nickel transport system permease protein
MLLILLTLIFIILRVLPGDPVYFIVSPQAGEHIIEQTRHELGLDRPIWEQYVSYLMGVFRGDLGKSYITKDNVWSIIGRHLPITIELATCGLFVAAFLGISFGTFAAYKSKSWFGVFNTILSTIAYTMPVFWFGMILQILFAIQFRVLPATGILDTSLSITRITGLPALDALITGNMRAFVDHVARLILPSITLGFFISGNINRMTHSNVLKALNEDYVRAARARGIKERVILFKYALKNSLIPVITLLGMNFARMLSGSVLTETVFSIPGMGSLLVNSIFRRDYPLVQGIIVVYALLISIVTLIIDIIYAYIDPRIRL